MCMVSWVHMKYLGVMVTWMLAKKFKMFLELLIELMGLRSPLVSVWQTLYSVIRFNCSLPVLDVSKKRSAVNHSICLVLCTAWSRTDCADRLWASIGKVLEHKASWCHLVFHSNTYYNFRLTKKSIMYFLSWQKYMHTLTDSFWWRWLHTWEGLLKSHWVWTASKIALTELSMCSHKSGLNFDYQWCYHNWWQRCKLSHHSLVV